MIGMYYHNGSFNHGCEAIVRSTHLIMQGEPLTLYSRKPDSDQAYELSDIVSIVHDREEEVSRKSLSYAYAAVMRRFFDDRYHITVLQRKRLFESVSKGDVMMSIGGDNYCYPGTDILGHYHTALKKAGANTVLWGCSVDPEYMTDQVKKDMARYDLITAREEISYNLLKEINPNTVKVSDPAFVLPQLQLPLPKEFVEGNTVGINVSPLIMQCERTPGITMRNYENLIQCILTNTDMNVVLIPHVVEPKNDDRTVLSELFELFKNTGRVCLIDDCNCMEIKGYISRCRFFVGARTHATIAAYSTGVPTLVVGYSTKSKGIARDLFGTEEGYVLPVQSLSEDDVLAKNFSDFVEKETFVSSLLKKRMPSYCANSHAAKDRILELAHNK